MKLWRVMKAWKDGKGKKAEKRSQHYIAMAETKEAAIALVRAEQTCHNETAEWCAAECEGGWEFA